MMDIAPAAGAGGGVPDSAPYRGTGSAIAAGRDEIYALAVAAGSSLLAERHRSHVHGQLRVARRLPRTAAPRAVRPPPMPRLRGQQTEQARTGSETAPDRDR